jgi:hypothetical protein
VAPTQRGHPPAVRAWATCAGSAAKDRDIALHTPLFGVLSAAADASPERLACGQALARVLLGVTAAGGTAAFVDQPVEVGTLYLRLAQAVGTVPEVPQLLLRMGYGPEVPPSAPRPLEVVRREARPQRHPGSSRGSSLVPGSDDPP